jgi:hypothetical protein
MENELEYGDYEAQIPNENGDWDGAWGDITEAQDGQDYRSGDDNPRDRE